MIPSTGVLPYRNLIDVMEMVKKLMTYSEESRDVQKKDARNSEAVLAVLYATIRWGRQHGSMQTCSCIIAFLHRSCDVGFLQAHQTTEQCSLGLTTSMLTNCQAAGAVEMEPFALATPMPMRVSG